MKILQKLASLITLVATAVSCHHEAESIVHTPSDMCQAVSFALPLAATRTAIDTEDGRTTEEVLEDFWELMGEGWDDGSGGGISQEAIDNQTVAPDYGKVTGRDWD